MNIVGLGASAGGLEPLGQFLAAVPAHSGLAFIVVQHMDPTHRGMLAELLQRVTTMPVCEATESMRVRPGVVYVIPPNADLTVTHGVLHLTEPAQPRGQRLPIDVLFASLARDQGDHAIGVVLSGMGSDGTLGLMEIKSQGGLTLIQTPESAQFDSMPRSALAAGCVDIVALPAELPAHIGRIAMPAAAAAADDNPAASDDVSTLDAILGHLREQTRHDLSLYKSSTLVRRIERRMAVHGFDTMARYEESVRHNPQELNLLFKEMLIGVTSFFRDPDTWRELQSTILPALLARPADTQSLRAWVVGCSTGEEAYSLAMVFRELADALPDGHRPTLQIFATDLNEDAIAAARKGCFPASIAGAVSPARLGRFFVPHGAGYLVAQNIREMVLFAQHDAILDPPFTRIDILSCRNLMIYFNNALQRRLLPLFHYCLRPGGTLILGGSETVGRWRTLFTPIQAKSKLYRRCDNAVSPVDFPVRRPHSMAASRQEPSVTQSSDRPPNLQAVAEHALLQQFAPPAVLVNASGDILYINGRTGRYLEPAAGKANWNIHVMARKGIRTQLSVALRNVLKDYGKLELQGLRLTDAPAATLSITLQALREPKALEGMVMIVFRDVLSALPGDTPDALGSSGGDAGLELELQHSREEIQALRDEMQATHEELQAANEELQSTNEELQSANEELTTSKEEAQSMNEELQTINQELVSKLDALALAQSDMQNLLNSTEIATLFLDNELNVRRFTEQVTRLIQLRDSDIGRPLSDLASVLIYPQLYADVKETLRTLAFCEKQIPTTDGRWYSMRIMPYRTLTNTIQGAVITFVDITAAKELESRLRNQ